MALSPVLGFILSAALYFALSRTVRDEHLYEPAGEHPPIWWMRGVLILTCTGVSFAHGTNDGQKSIGLIMLTIIGLFPAVFALNPEAVRALEDLPNIARQVEPLIEKYGDDQKSDALNAAKALEDYKAEPPASASLSDILRLKDGQDGRLGVASETAKERQGSATTSTSSSRSSSTLKRSRASARRAKGKEVTRQRTWGARRVHSLLGTSLALWLGIGTMIGYPLIVDDTWQCLGKDPL